VAIPSTIRHSTLCSFGTPTHVSNSSGLEIGQRIGQLRSETFKLLVHADLAPASAVTPLEPLHRSYL
jgi:hypothetical protein